MTRRPDRLTAEDSALTTNDGVLSSLIDTFPAFLAYWGEVRGRPLEEQVARWASDYLAPWPELLAKQTADYAAQGLDWAAVARERVFAAFDERLPLMEEAHRNLLRACGPTLRRAGRVLGWQGEVTLVIHVGIGCGAGWVTTDDGLPAILFGLENVAECGWSDAAAIAGLVAHECGHLVHGGWRRAAGRARGSGPWWRLYEEGFAQRCEVLLEGEEACHQAQSSGGEWLQWCRCHEAWLAAEFLRAVDAGDSVTAFFGSWLRVRGHSETGYYLGARALSMLEETLGLREAALREDAEGCLRPILERMRSSGGPGD